MIGQTLAHYEILEKIGSGGMGDVYLAEDNKLGRKVALKVLLPPELAESEERRARFKREAKALAALDHPNIVQVFSVEETDGIHFITMQLVHGKTLTELLPKNGFSLSKFFDIAIPMADAVAAAHQEGITHRDLKPDNMMVGDDGRIRVLDFGLAKPSGRFVEKDGASEQPTQAKTAEGVIVGTVSYIWEQSLDENGNVAGEAIAVTTGLGVRHASFSRDGSKLAYARGRRISNVWRVPISTDRPATWAEAEQLTFDQAFVEMLDVSKDGRLVLSTDRSGNPDLWIRDAESGEMQQLTTDSTPDWAPKWSPDGEEVAFYAFRGGKRELWTVPAGGGKARKVTGIEDRGIYPDWSPDGQSIAFFVADDVWIVPAEDGEARRVTTDPAADSTPIWSPDGRSLAFLSLRTNEQRLWQLELETGQLEQLSEGPAATRDGRGMEPVFILSVPRKDGRTFGLSLSKTAPRPP